MAPARRPPFEFIPCGAAGQGKSSAAALLAQIEGKSMSAETFEGVVEQGQIKLNSDVRLPDGTKVFIVVPDIEIEETGVHLRSPRLAHPEQAADFVMEVVES